MKPGDLITDIPTIGLVMDFFNPKILDGAHSYTEEHNLLLDARWSVRGDWTPEKPGWNGVIYSIVDDAPLMKRIKQWKTPKVSIMPDITEDWMVDPDYEQCGRLAAEEMMQAGATTLLNIAISNRSIDFHFARGVEKFAKSHHIPCHKIELHVPRLSELLANMVTEIQALPFPLGICQPHAGVAYSLQKELLKNGIRIPEDVSMVVIDKDIQLTPNLAVVPLTTVELDEWHRGFVAAEMLHHLINDDPLPQNHIIIPPKGVTRRASTGHEEVQDRIVASALSYVRKNYLQPIGVGEVVTAAGASRRLVEMRFRQVLNRGIHEELTRLRIEEAKRQITNRDSNITTIAEACGFSSVHYFSAAFKREAGLSPKAYQKQATQE